jgi:uncharacterized protein YggE
MNVTEELKKTNRYPYGTVRVDGSASIEVPPDLVKFYCKIHSEALSIGMAISGVNVIREKFINSLSRFTAKQFKIVSEQRSATDTIKTKTGVMFTAYLTLKLELYDLAILGVVVDLATAAAINEIYSAEYGVSNPQQYELNVLELAAAVAREKAKRIATANERALGEIIEISESLGGQYYSTRGLAMASQSESTVYRQPTNTSSENIHFDAKVEATYAVGQK